MDLREFETELIAPLLLVSSSDPDTDEAVIVDALLHSNCNPIQMHMRVKKGFNDTMSMDELRDMPSDKADAARNLAQFYMRIANLRSRILNELQQMQQSDESTHSDQLHHSEQLQRAYATELENMRNKQRENREHFARILRTIILDPDSENRRVHPDLTDATLDALELQVHDIMERGCTSNQLRCVKIREAAIEQQIYDALIAELNDLNA
jgi:hypothetical protein